MSDPQHLILVNVVWYENSLNMKRDGVRCGDLSEVTQYNLVVNTCIVSMQCRRYSFDAENDLVHHRQGWKFSAVGKKNKGTIIRLLQGSQDTVQHWVAYRFGAHEHDLF